MTVNTLTPARTAQPTAEPATSRTPDRKIFFGTAVVLLAATAVGLALGVGSAADTATTGAVVPSTGAVSHVMPDHLLQPK